MDFVARVARDGFPECVPPADRIAVFDNDGTLWSEQPFYVQGLFLFDRVRDLAVRHPEWARTQLFQAVLDRDWHTLARAGEHGLLELVMATHAGMTTAEFARLVGDWPAAARHPRFDRPFIHLVYQPMLELLAYLRANGFKAFIVSGGGIEFVRSFSERVYGVPPEQVVGSSIKTRYEVRDGTPVLVRLAELDVLDDKAGKPVGINQHVERRPIAAFGNSDGDFEMLEWTTAGPGPGFGLLLHHDAGEREFAYDRHSTAGRLARGWTVVSMKHDWQRLCPFEPAR